MNGTALLWLPDVLRAAGVNVILQDGWETRSRSSGGFVDGKPFACFWHHTASNTTPENDAHYCSFGSDSRPIANLLATRDGTVWILAAGATNTNGKGQRLQFSRGVVEMDQANTSVVGMEICNTGLGEPYPQAQIDACFAVSNAINAHLGNQPTDVASHHQYAKDRKIDPATAYAVQGPWAPRSLNSSGTWNDDDLRAECASRAGTAPTPPTPPQPGDDDDMQVRLLILTDSDAQFIAMTTNDGQALYATWAGPGSPEVDRAVAAHRAAAEAKGQDFEQPGDIAGLFNCVRVGESPYGDSRHTWDGSEFWKAVT